jgi:capsular polysaccharide biosynthesis protein
MTKLRAASEQFKDGCDVIWRRRIVVMVTFFGLVAAALLLQTFLPRTFEAGANVLVVNGNTRSDPSLTSTDLPSIATSTVVLDRVRAKLHLQIPLTEMKRNVKAKSPPFHSGIMRIAYADQQPDRAVSVANGIADELTQYYREVSTERYDENVRDLDAALDDQKDRLRLIDSRLQTQAGGTAVPSDAKASDSIAGRIADLEAQRALANASLAGDVAQLTLVHGDTATRDKMARYEILQNDPLYRNLSAGASKDAAQLAFDQASYTKLYPGLPGLTAKVRSEQMALDAEAQRAMRAPEAYSPSAAAAGTDLRRAQAAVETDRAKVAALDSLIDKGRAQLSALPPIQLLQLERDAAQADYLSLSGHRATVLASRAEALSLGSVVVVDRAIRTESQVGIGRTRLALLATAIILLIALASAFAAEQLDPRLRRAEQMEDLYGKPVIATLSNR